MEVNQVIKLGSLQIPVSLLMLSIGLFISVVIVEMLSKRKNIVTQARGTQAKWSDFVLTHLLVFLVIYKSGWIIFDLKSVIENPSLILWTSSSSFTMAFVVTLIVFLYKVRKSNYTLFEILDNLYITFIIVLLTYSLVIIDYGKATDLIFGISINGNSDYTYHPINWYKSILAIALILLRYKLRTNLDLVRLLELYIVLGVGLLLISILDVHPNLVYGFSLEQWFYITITLIGSIGLIRYSNKR